MITAEDLLKNNLSKIHEKDIIEDLLQRLFTFDVSEIMIEFAQLHVVEALAQASEQAKIQYDYSGNTGSEFCDEYIDKDSILNAYPLDKIK
jgi:hypothetical protein